MSPKILCLILGLVIGVSVGYLTRPEAAQIRVGPISVEVQGQVPAQRTGPLTRGQLQHIGLAGLIGGAIGLGIGFAVDRRRKIM